MKNYIELRILALVILLGLTFTSCQIDQVEELEGPTQVAAKPKIGPSSIAARISDVAKDGKEIFDITEVMPMPVGGMEAWNSYISKNLIYPEEAKKHGVEGTVIAVFVINADGTISNPEILRGIGGGADEEVIRLLENAPDWIPAKQKDRVVNSRMRLPIRFKLS